MEINEDSPADAHVAAWNCQDFFGPESLTKQEFAVMVAADVDVQVTNGGVSQYLSNPSHLYASHAPESLRTIGAPKAAAVLQQVLSVCTATTETLKREFNDLTYTRYRLPAAGVCGLEFDEAYYASEPVWDLLRAYIIAERSQIRTFREVKAMIIERGLDPETRQRKREVLVQQLNSQWSGRERPCPKCGRVFRSGQCRGQCPDCGHTFFASHPTEYEKFPW